MSKKSELEKDFELANEKLKQAAALMREANELAGKHGKIFCDWENGYPEFCREEFPAINDLMGALDEGGWSTSSMSC